MADLQHQYGGPSSSTEVREWPSERYVTLRFLEDILLNQPYRNLIPRQGVRIAGVRITGEIDLRGAKIGSDLRLTGSRFDGGLDFRNLRSEGTLDLTSSTILGQTKMGGMQVANSLVLADATFMDINLLDIKIGADLISGGITVTGKFDADAIQVGGIAYFKGAKFLKRPCTVRLGPQVCGGYVRLRGGKIGDQMVMDDATVQGNLDLQDLRVAGSLLMREVRILGTYAWLGYAQIGGNLDFSGYFIKPTDLAECVVREGEESSPPSEPGRLPYDLDLTAATVGHGLRFGSCKRRPPRWPPHDTWLVLRNTSVRELQDRDEKCCPKRDSDCRDSWPQNIVFDGFTYQRLSVMDLDANSNMASRPGTWWTDWLMRQNDYSPQPYEQLASVLNTLGYLETAKEVRFAGKDRELVDPRTSFISRILLRLLRWFIGYGYYPYQSVYWAIGFILAGAAVLRISKEGPCNNMPYGLAYSFDMLLPLVKLSEAHSKVKLKKRWVVYYFYGQKLMGYILGSFLLASLSGLTR